MNAEKEPTLFDRLAEPFPAKEVKWKPQSVKGNRASAMAYIDARHVMDRLDQVVGPGEWQDEYKVLDDGSVVCTLAVRVNGEWISKTDVGSLSAQPDAGDRLKAAFSDALKRAAVKWGIGRYLYRLSAQWVDYDPAKKQFAQRPSLPFWAIPESERAKPAAQARPSGGKSSRPATEFQPGDEALLSPEVREILRQFEAATTDKNYRDAVEKTQAGWYEPWMNNAGRAALTAAEEAAYTRISQGGEDVPF